MDKNIIAFIEENKDIIKQKSYTISQEESPRTTPQQNNNNHDKYLTLSKADCIKHLIPNTIVSGVIVSISYDDNTKKKKTILVRLRTLLSFVLPEQSETMNNLDNLSQYQSRELISHLYSHNIIGVISQDEIYDKQLVHLNEIIDSNLVVGNEISSMITTIIKEEQIVNITLRNSLIKGKQQVFVKGNDYLLNIPYNLGMKMKHESEERNEKYLSNKLSQYNIQQYGTGNDPKLFDYEVLRKIQNYDWGDEYLSKGDVLSQEGLLYLAIDNYEEAEKLDPLNTEVYIKKGNACIKVGEIKKAISSFKNCLKIDPYNQEARQYIEDLYKRKGGNSNGNSYLNKKRKNE